MEVQKIIAKVEATPVPEVKKVALAYSGGLDSSLAIELLRRSYKVSDIVPINVDLLIHVYILYKFYYLASSKGNSYFLFLTAV